MEKVHPAIKITSKQQSKAVKVGFGPSGHANNFLWIPKRDVRSAASSPARATSRKGACAHSSVVHIIFDPHLSSRSETMALAFRRAKSHSAQRLYPSPRVLQPHHSREPSAFSWRQLLLLGLGRPPCKKTQLGNVSARSCPKRALRTGTVQQLNNHSGFMHVAPRKASKVADCEFQNGKCVAGRARHCWDRAPS